MEGSAEGQQKLGKKLQTPSSLKGSFVQLETFWQGFGGCPGLLQEAIQLRSVLQFKAAHRSSSTKILKIKKT